MQQQQRQRQSVVPSMEPHDIKRIYGSYAGVYDFIFKRWFLPRQQHVIQAVSFESGQRVLDLGVGTGLSLPLYPSDVQVMGVDLSRKMLREARKKVQRERLDQVSLLEMDAAHLAFPDNTFDVVIAAFVISVVPDPVEVIAEMKRVSKPDGQLIFINHFQSDNRFMARFEKWLSPMCTKIGWRSDLALEDLIQRAALQVERTYSLYKIDLWKVVYATNNK